MRRSAIGSRASIERTSYFCTQTIPRLSLQMWDCVVKLPIWSSVNDISLKCSRIRWIPGPGVSEDTTWSRMGAWTHGRIYSHVFIWFKCSKLGPAFPRLILDLRSTPYGVSIWKIQAPPGSLRLLSGMHWPLGDPPICAWTLLYKWEYLEFFHMVNTGSTTRGFFLFGNTIPVISNFSVITEYSIIMQGDSWPPSI